MKLQTHIDHAFFLPHTDKPALGSLLLKGWAFTPKATKLDDSHLELIVLCERQTLGQAVCNEDRADVQTVFPEAPTRCGYEFLIPEIPVSQLDNLQLSYHVNEQCLTTEPIPVRLIQNADDWLPGQTLSDALRRKADNYILNERERLSQASMLRSKPVHLYIDPNFNCQLECPHCVSDMLRETGFNMKSMQPNLLDTILEQYGDTLLSVNLTGWGEPLLNKHFSDFVVRIKQHSIWVETSTNLSLSLSDARIEALVRSGLDSVRLSIDGATQAVYEQYRGKGNLQLVLDNIRKIVACKQKLGTDKPFLKWQFLVFPWNQHEIITAEALAHELGVDQFYAMDGQLTPRTEKSTQSRATEQQPELINAQTQARLQLLKQERRKALGYFGCDPLYRSLFINSNGSITPCCYMVEPRFNCGEITVGSEHNDVQFNSEVHQANRKLFADIDQSEVRGYDPCSQCFLMLEGPLSPAGYVSGPVEFFTAYQYFKGGGFLF